MVPNKFIYLDKFPLTVNGKLDRKALPIPELIDIDRYVAPENQVQEMMCKIWSEVLGIPEDKVGINDDFFRLGGDSIISIQLISRLKSKLGLNISIKDIFNYKTIEKIYDQSVSQFNQVKSVLKTEQGLLTGEFELLPIQQWFLSKNFKYPNHWNQSCLIKTPKLDINILRTSITNLIKYHDNFRLRYKKPINIDSTQDLGTNYIQYYNVNFVPEELKILDIKTLKSKEGSRKFIKQLEAILTDWQSNFDLEHGPLYSVGYIYGYSDGSCRIFFALHHLIVDGVSWRILIEDLKNIYYQKDLGLKGSSYRQWVNAVRQYHSIHQEGKAYWKNVISDYNKNNKMNNLILNDDTKNVIHIKLNQKQTKQLLKESNKVYNTQINDVLLTALGYTLQKFTDSRVNHIILEGHGREEIDSSIDVSRTCGWFTTMYPVRLEISEDLGNSLKNIKENLRCIPDKGIGYGALIGYDQGILPIVNFNYLGQFAQDAQSNDSKNLWNIVSENSGLSIHRGNQNHSIISINAIVIDKYFQITFAGSMDKQQLGEMASVFKHNIEKIINYTTKQSRSYLTTSDVDYIITQEYLDYLQKEREIVAVYLANSLQQGFIYHTLKQGDRDDAYRSQSIWQYNCLIDPKKLNTAWSYAQAKFCSLRLRFCWNNEIVQVIDKQSELYWQYIDLSKEMCTTIQALKISKIQEQDRVNVYRLDKGSLFRIYLIKKQYNLYTCIFSHHHSIIDGWSIPILLRYVHEVYLQLVANKKVEIKVDNSYGYVQKYLQDYCNDNKDYWEKYILRISERTNLGGLLSQLARNKNLKISEFKYVLEPDKERLIIEQKIYIDLKEMSSRYGVTLNAILQYVWHKVLHVYSNCNQTVVGTTVSGRKLPIEDAENSVGLYINTLPLIVEHNQKKKNVLELIKDIQNVIHEFNSKSNVNLSRLQKGGIRLFDSLLVYKNYPINAIVSDYQNNQINITFDEGIIGIEYPLVVTVYENNNQLNFVLQYAKELFDQDTIKQLLLLVKVLIEQITRNPEQKPQELKYIEV
jgi:non-ribosomal peptide synthase protein (TIGR01720 family)